MYLLCLAHVINYTNFSPGVAEKNLKVGLHCTHLLVSLLLLVDKTIKFPLHKVFDDMRASTVSP